MAQMSRENPKGISASNHKKFGLKIKCPFVIFNSLDIV